MKKVVISGSSKLQDKVNYWLNMGWIKIYDSEKCTNGGKNE